LTVEERQSLAEAWRRAAQGTDFKVVIHVGHNCVADARRLAAHAESIGAPAIAALSPSYFKPANPPALVEVLSEVAAAAPQTPFYFYDIPSWTGVSSPVRQLLELASRQIPTFRGIKYTNQDLAQLQVALRFENGRYDILWGCDEALLAGWALGCRGAVGSTYNFAAPIYLRIIDAFQRGDWQTARDEQAKAVEMVLAIAKFGFTPAAKSVMGMIGVDCGPARLPLTPLDSKQIAQLREELTQLGFFEWISPSGEIHPRGSGSVPVPHRLHSPVLTKPE
jgi:N-acetylneuraminate lyase